jgi:hypothetical protein
MDPRAELDGVAAWRRRKLRGRLAQVPIAQVALDRGDRCLVRRTSQIDLKIGHPLRDQFEAARGDQVRPGRDGSIELRLEVFFIAVAAKRYAHVYFPAAEDPTLGGYHCDVCSRTHRPANNFHSRENEYCNRGNSG